MVKQKGFSLIELMIATALLSMVMFTGYFAYSLYTDKWQKRADHFWQLNQSALGTEAIIRTLEAASVYIVRDQKEQFSILFEGQQTGITLVTNTGLFSNETALINIKAIDQENGLQSLLYSEMPLNNTLLLNYPIEENWQYQHILVNDIAKINFQFYGWETLENAVAGNLDSAELSIGETRVKRRWYTEHNLPNNRLLPNKLALFFENEQQQVTHIQVDLINVSYLDLVRHLRLDV